LFCFVLSIAGVAATDRIALEVAAPFRRQAFDCAAAVEPDKPANGIDRIGSNDMRDAILIPGAVFPVPVIGSAAVILAVRAFRWWMVGDVRGPLDGDRLVLSAAIPYDIPLALVMRIRPEKVHGPMHGISSVDFLCHQQPLLLFR
jgi:hypothetical protein